MCYKSLIASWQRPGLLLASLLCLAPSGLVAVEPLTADAATAASTAVERDRQDAAGFRGPVDLVLGEHEDWAVTVNELSNSLSLIDLATGRVAAEIACEGRPVACVRLPDDQLLVSCRDAGEVRRFQVHQVAGQLSLSAVAAIAVGFEPLGLAVADGNGAGTVARAYVGLVASGEVAEIDLQSNKLLRRLSVGNWPRYLAVSPDGSTLAVGLSGDSSVAVLALPSGELAYEEPLSGAINLGQMRSSRDGTQVYFPWMIYRSNPIDPGNIRRGWVLASRIARVRLDGPAYREAISLDVPGLAVADPHGLAIAPDETRMAVTSAGTHELLVYRIADMPFIGAGGPGDLIDEKLRHNGEAFYRIPLGGRPLGVEPSSDNRTVYVANHTLDSLQVVDLDRRKLVASISLGDPAESQDEQLVHRGLQIFHDATRSLDQWYSCRSCHLDGGSNAKPMDTWNDGRDLNPKTVLPLAGVTETGPWTWHGWQQELEDSIQNSFTETMQGPAASVEDLRAVKAYLDSLQRAPNPFLTAANQPRSTLAETIEQGRQLFHSSAVGCGDCHSGPRFTDGEIHDVGLGSESDKYQGFNTPSLIGVYAKVRWLHDGRSKSLQDVLTNWHSPSEIGGGAELTDEQMSQLIAYLKTL